MKEIPSELMTAILPDVQLNRDFEVLPIGFVNRRRANKSYLINKIIYLTPDSISPEFITLKNSGFTLELGELDSYNEVYLHLLIDHPELPKRENYKYGIPINCDNAWRILRLISYSGGMVKRKLNGTFFYDPSINFFVLDNNPEKTQKEKDLGAKLSGTWKKIVPGHEYYLEIGPRKLQLLRAIYLGDLNDIRLYKGWHWNKTYQTFYPNRFDYMSSTGECITTNAKLFRSLEPEESYFLTTKKNIRGIDLGDTGETMTKQDYESLSLSNNWILGVNWDFKLIKTNILPKLITHVNYYKGSVPSYNIMGRYSNINLATLDSNSLYELLETAIKAMSYPHWSFGDMIGFCRLFDPDCLGITLGKQEIIDLFHELFISCFGRD